MAKKSNHIKQLEILTSTDLVETPLKLIITGYINGYALDEKGRIIGLSFFGAGIKDISFISKFPHLTHLKLSNNNISDISPLKDLKSLISLRLSANQIVDISPLKDLTNLEELSLWGNHIVDISPLKKIIYSGIEIVWGSEYGKGLFLSENPIEKPPKEIVKTGSDAVIAWFRSLEKGGKRALNEVKLLLVGDGGAGKTSLVKQLLTMPFDSNESQTHGITIKRHEVSPKKNSDKIRVNIWDFGGQEIMHATHQFFLSRRSLYILVLDGRKDEKPEYWLKHIETFGGDSPVLVVINKIDENPSFDVNRIFLKEKYPNIKGFFRLSCATGQGIAAFIKILERELADVEFINTTWAQSWFNVKSQLEAMEKDIISYNEYKSLCHKEGIDDEISRETLVGFLNDLGIVLHFKDFKLKATNVLNPEWVTTAVYKIINSREISDAMGFLILNRLDSILKKRNKNEYHYPPEKHKYIVELMQKFELCYEIDGETVLIPNLLEVQQPEFEFNYNSALKFIIDYEFLPPSVMPRFIVKMHRDIKQDKEKSLQWRTGVVLEEKAFGCTAVVKSDIDAGRILIYVQGDQKRDYFAAILFTFRSINKSFEKLKAVEKVPMPDEEKVTVSYNHLILLEQEGDKDYRPDGSKKKYNVKDLLGTVHVPIEKENEDEILGILRKLKEKFDTEETLLEKANDIFQVNPNLFGVGINFNQLVKKLFK